MYEKTNISDKSVLVTGCSSGIGQASALHLAHQGTIVFAGVRKESDAAALRDLGLPNLIPLCPLDLSQPQHISAALETVRTELSLRGMDGLYAVVNNAGAGAISPLELLDLDAFHSDLQARILGPLGLLQAFLPQIRRSGGRIIWVVTPGLLPTPFVASIHACDFAVQCLARTLNIELKRWNIPSIMVRCGGIKTAAPAKTNALLEEAAKKWPQERFELYAGALKKEMGNLVQFDTKRTGAEEVARVIEKALRDPKPKSRYRVGYMSGAAAFLELLPQNLADALLGMRY
jgi:NAD(P)-dependent dehydrogenase (short-subunit alcohol dehydrogenase family)